MALSDVKERVSTAPGRFGLKQNEYGTHFYRILEDLQRVDYTVTKIGMIVRKYNFVPKKGTFFPGTMAFGNRWEGIRNYERSPLCDSDLALCVKHGAKEQGDNQGSSVGAVPC